MNCCEYTTQVDRPFKSAPRRTHEQLKGITSEAYRDAQEIIGEADAEATKIYAEAYEEDPEFYRFLKTLETYGGTIDDESWMILTTDGEFFRHLKSTKK